MVLVRFTFNNVFKKVKGKRPGIQTEKMKQILSCLEIDTKTRPEQIPPQKYVKLYQKCFMDRFARLGRVIDF